MAVEMHRHAENGPEAADLRSEPERYLRTLLQLVPAVIWATDRELRLQYAVGCTPSAAQADARGLLGVSVYEFVGTRDPTQPAVAHHLAALAGKLQVFPYERGGRSYDVRIEPLRDPREQIVGCVGAAVDVTERTESAGAHERSRSLLQAAVEATADAVLVVDRAGKVTLVNRRMRAQWGLPPQYGEATDEAAILDVMLPQVEDPDGFWAGILELQARPESESVEVVHLHDGRVFERCSRPQRVAGAVVGRVWSYRDVTERERLERRALFLADATRLLASLDVEGALDAVAHLIVPGLGDGCAIDLCEDRELRRLLAVSRDPGHPISPDVHPSVLAAHPILYRVQATSYLGVPLVAKGGILGALTLAAAPERRYAQADLELAEELGRRAALAIENARLYQQAQQALRARDEFLAIASHEIRGPITSLHLAVQLLRRGQIPKHAQAATFEMIEREDQRLGRFVDELLELSRIRAGTLRLDFEQVELGEVVRNVTTRLGAELTRARSSLAVAIEGCVRGEWDRLRLDQIVTNLLSNSIKFGLGKPILVNVSTHEDRAVLVVKDQGIGIPAELQERIFQPFERGISVRHYGGLGLGLYIVKTSAEAMGGCVSVESTLGAGSTFRVELPQTRSNR